MEEGRKSSSEQHAGQVNARTLDVSQKQAKSLEADRKYLEEVSVFKTKLSYYLNMVLKRNSTGAEEVARSSVSLLIRAGSVR